MVPNKNAVFEKYESWYWSLDMDRSECREGLGRTYTRFEKLWRIIEGTRMGVPKVFTSGYRQLLSCQGVSPSGVMLQIDLFRVVWLSTAGGSCYDVLGVMEEIKGSVRKLGFAEKLSMSNYDVRYATRLFFQVWLRFYIIQNHTAT